ncbi:MAG: alpha/beta hydrolase [Lachnospiraceae bacterium]|nr:alpha/beta hydrolase [Lachnospiraceae bacterium]
MNDSLKWKPDSGQTETLELKGQSVTYRAFRNIPYVEHPVCPEHQKMNIFVPEEYFRGESVNGLTAETAPIFLPNAVGAYAAGRADAPGMNFRSWGRDQINALFVALQKGFVVAAPASRGRNSVKESGETAGAAPACIVDLKAAVRFLRHNRDVIPGNTERIISDGTSAGGALSALLGVSGNSPDYEPYLQEIGAAEERDDIFAAICFCPIMNLEHADMAYEWLLEGLNDYHSLRFRVNEEGTVIGEPYAGTLTPEQEQASRELRAMFVEYVNGLYLCVNGTQELSLDAQGDGTFKDNLVRYLMASAQRALDAGADLSAAPYVTVKDGQVTGFDLRAHMERLQRMKPVPAFDDWDGISAENELFQTETERFRHFTEFGLAHDTGGRSLAEPELIRAMNPMEYADGQNSDVARHFRIRYGTTDCHTSWAIPMIFAETLKQKDPSLDVDFQLAWDKSHCGDYDMDDMFAWAKEIALGE